jgi:hypothetical protein
MGKKRDTKTDVPRRIWRENIERIDAHLNKDLKQAKTSKRLIKPDFNEFLKKLLDSYEFLLNSERVYALDTYSDPAEARGEAIQRAAKTKTPIQWPKAFIEVG